MASFLSLSAELKLSIVEQLDHASTSFIPGPSQDLLNFGYVCKAFRNLAIPYILRDLVLLNDERSGSSVLAIFESSLAKLVHSVHYIGVMEMPSKDRMENASEPSPEDLPLNVEQVLCSLNRLPNLERTVVEFRSAKDVVEDESIYEGSYDYFEELESYEEALGSEKRDAYWSLMKRSYDALARNPASTIRNLELRNITPKRCSSWERIEFQALLNQISSFTISLRGGGNGIGWQLNKVPAYLTFVESLDSFFFKHLLQTIIFRFSATIDGPPGLPRGLNNAGLPLKYDQLPNLRRLELKHVFINSGLSGFIANHRRLLEEVRLDKCYSGLVYNDVPSDVALSWGEFFSYIAESEMTALRRFEVGPSDCETEPIPEPNTYDYARIVQSKKLLENCPGRRMFDYKCTHDEYGSLYETELNEEKFEEGADHASWERLVTMLGSG